MKHTDAKVTVENIDNKWISKSPSFDDLTLEESFSILVSEEKKSMSRLSELESSIFILTKVREPGGRVRISAVVDSYDNFKKIDKMIIDDGAIEILIKKEEKQ